MTTRVDREKLARAAEKYESLLARLADVSAKFAGGGVVETTITTKDLADFVTAARELLAQVPASDEEIANASDRALANSYALGVVDRDDYADHGDIWRACERHHGIGGKP